MPSADRRPELRLVQPTERVPPVGAAGPLVLVGMNHRSAPVEVREGAALDGDAALAALTDGLTGPLIRELVLISTCNRTELYAHLATADVAAGAESLIGLLRRHAPNAAFDRSHLYLLHGEAAVTHLLRVAAGLDSMMLGEGQILAQLRAAHAASAQASASGAVLNRLFQTAFRAGKRARTETEIGQGAVSVSLAAAELAAKICGDLRRRSALVIGAGETGELAARHLTGKGIGRLLIANRTAERASALSERVGAEAVPLEALGRHLSEVDIVVSATGSPEILVTADDVRRAMSARGGRMLVMIDIAVPRDLDPEIRRIDDVFLHDIDDLQGLVQQNLARRLAEVPSVEKILAEERTGFFGWLEQLELTPTLRDLTRQFERIRRQEVAKQLKRFRQDDHEALELMTRALVKKLLHLPLAQLRAYAATGDATRIESVRDLFGLDDDGQEGGGES